MKKAYVAILVLTLASASFAADWPGDVIAAWDFEQNGYSDTNGHTLTSVGSPTYNSDQSHMGSYSLQVSSGSNAFKLPASLTSELAQSTTFTVEGWVYITEAMANNSWSPPIAGRWVADSYTFSVMFKAYSDRIAYVFAFHTSWNSELYGEAVDGWNHWSVQWDGSQVKGYVNGANVVTFNNVTTNPFSNTVDRGIGYSPQYPAEYNGSVRYDNFVVSDSLRNGAQTTPVPSSDTPTATKTVTPFLTPTETVTFTATRTYTITPTFTITPVDCVGNYEWPQDVAAVYMLNGNFCDDTGSHAGLIQGGNGGYFSSRHYYDEYSWYNDTGGNYRRFPVSVETALGGASEWTIEFMHYVPAKEDGVHAEFTLWRGLPDWYPFQNGDFHYHFSRSTTWAPDYRWLCANTTETTHTWSTYPSEGWHHTSISWDGTAMKLYMDGTYLSSITSSNPFAVTSRNGYFYLGIAAYGSGGAHNTAMGIQRIIFSLTDREGEETDPVPPTPTVTPTITSSITPSVTPTATVTSTSTVTPTNTPINTPVGGGCWIDNNEDQDDRNEFGGLWYSYSDGSPSYVWPETGTAFVMSQGGADGTSYAVRVTGYVGESGSTYPDIGVSAGLNYYSGSPSYQETDLSQCDGIRFYTKGNGKAYRIKIPYTDSSGLSMTGGNDYSFMFVAPPAWTQIYVPFVMFAQQSGWGTQRNLQDVLAHAKELRWQTGFFAVSGTADADLWLDEIVILGCTASCPPLTVQPTRTATITRTYTPFVTATVTRTVTLTKTLTPTLTLTETPTMTFSATFTPTYTGTVNMWENQVKFTLEYKNISCGTSQIRPKIRITNNSSYSLDLVQLKLKYWFTDEGASSMPDSGAVLSAVSDDGAADISASVFASVTTEDKGGNNRALSITFLKSAGMLAPGKYAEIDCTANNGGGEDYTLTNDWSYDSGASSYTETGKITGYYAGRYVYGMEPVSAGNVSISINCGGVYTGSGLQDGVYVQGGFGSVGALATFTNYTQPIANTDNDFEYQSMVVGSPGAPIKYNIDNLSSGDYTVKFGFAEIRPGVGVGDEVMDIYIEGVKVFEAIDIMALAGFASAYNLVTTVAVTDGQMNVEFTGSLQNLLNIYSSGLTPQETPTLTPDPVWTYTPTMVPACQQAAPSSCEQFGRFSFDVESVYVNEMLKNDNTAYPSLRGFWSSGMPQPVFAKNVGSSLSSSQTNKSYAIGGFDVLDNNYGTNIGFCGNLFRNPDGAIEWNQYIDYDQIMENYQGSSSPGSVIWFNQFNHTDYYNLGNAHYRFSVILYKDGSVIKAMFNFTTKWGIEELILGNIASPAQSGWYKFSAKWRDGIFVINNRLLDSSNPLYNEAETVSTGYGARFEMSRFTDFATGAVTAIGYAETDKRIFFGENNSAHAPLDTLILGGDMWAEHFLPGFVDDIKFANCINAVDLTPTPYVPTPLATPTPEYPACAVAPAIAVFEFEPGYNLDEGVFTLEPSQPGSYAAVCNSRESMSGGYSYKGDAANYLKFPQALMDDLAARTEWTIEWWAKMAAPDTDACMINTMPENRYMPPGFKVYNRYQGAKDFSQVDTWNVDLSPTPVHTPYSRDTYVLHNEHDIGTNWARYRLVFNKNGINVLNGAGPTTWVLALYVNDEAIPVVFWTQLQNSWEYPFADPNLWQLILSNDSGVFVDRMSIFGEDITKCMPTYTPSPTWTHTITPTPSATLTPNYTLTPEYTCVISSPSHEYNFDSTDASQLLNDSVGTFHSKMSGQLIPYRKEPGQALQGFQYGSLSVPVRPLINTRSVIEFEAVLNIDNAADENSIVHIPLGPVSGNTGYIDLYLVPAATPTPGEAVVRLVYSAGPYAAPTEVVHDMPVITQSGWYKFQIQWNAPYGLGSDGIGGEFKFRLKKMCGPYDEDFSTITDSQPMLRVYGTNPNANIVFGGGYKYNGAVDDIKIWNCLGFNPTPEPNYDPRDTCHEN